MEEQSEFLYHTSCEGCNSSDANAVYDNYTTYCWSCERWDRIEEEDMQGLDKVEDVKLDMYDDLPVRGFRDRKIKKSVTEFFDVRVGMTGEEITHHYYPYTKDGLIHAYKEREVANKKFKAIGDMKNVELFGQCKFPQGGRRLVITEGEIDAMTVAQANLDSAGKIYPVVSIPNGATAKKALINNREWIRSFAEVILMFDQDEAGAKGANEAAKVIGADKVKVAKLTHKDPNESYLAKGQDEIQQQIWNAQPWCPPGVINGETTWDSYVSEREAIYFSYPAFVEGLNKKIYGRRPGSITMFTSGTGSGKTSFLREDAFHLFNTTDEMIGLCSLEESIAETVRGFIALDMDKRVGIPGVETDEEEEEVAWKNTLGSGRFMLLDHQGSVSDSSLIDKIEFMAASGCKFIYLDHITIAVSEVEGMSVNAALDKVMSDLLKICKRHDVWIGVVSHLRKTGNDQQSFEEGGDIAEDDLKGSGSLKQISAQIIALTRNKHAEDPDQRHTVKVKVLKDRFGGDTGWACEYRFNMQTGRLFSAAATELTGLKEL